MESKPDGKTRKEKRKEARLEKQKNRFVSWIEHQKSRKLKRKAVDSKSKHKKMSNTSINEFSDKREVRDVAVHNEEDGSDEHSPPKKAKKMSHSSEDLNSKEPSRKKHNKSLKTKSKTKFDEYLEMEMKRDAVSAEEDLKLERKLAKKLKVKSGKLRGLDDGLNEFFELPSIADSSTGAEVQTEGEDIKDPICNKSSKKRKKGKLTVAKEKEQDDEHEKAADLTGGESVEPVASGIAEVALKEPLAKPPAPTENVRYVPPHLRSQAGKESQEHIQIRRQVRGLLNRLSESNVESIAGEISTIYRVRKILAFVFHVFNLHPAIISLPKSIARSVSSQIISEEVLASCSRGPRGNEQYAAVFAAFVAGMACLVGVDFSAKLVAALAKSFEDEYSKDDNLSMRNLTLLLSYLCVFDVCSSDLIYDFLIVLSKRLTEVDVSTILTILQCCGMKLRGDDPAAMKDFILSVQNRVNELKSSASVPDNEQKTFNKRMEFMLETICDIKNNKKRTKEDSAQHTRIKKWLQKLKVEDSLLRGLKWSKLLDPQKKGQWWLSGDTTSTVDNAEEVASTIDREVLEAQKLLQIAAEQRMNTDARRAIFCIIMSGEDYVDAFEKLLRLDLPGKQDREIMRVLVNCCLQEKVFNKYYIVLASKLCSHDKNHKFTLQYCLWDHYKELESMELIRSMNLARFVAEMLTSFSLSLAVLKTVDLSNPIQLTAKRIMHFRMLFEYIFEQSDAIVWNIFTRVAVIPELETLRDGFVFFIKQYVATTNKTFSDKFKVAKKALGNVAGVLM